MQYGVLLSKPSQNYLGFVQSPRITTFAIRFTERQSEQAARGLPFNQHNSIFTLPSDDLEVPSGVQMASKGTMLAFSGAAVCTVSSALQVSNKRFKVTRDT
jgi:hypothetical protein